MMTLLVAATLALADAASAQDAPAPPVAARRPHAVVSPNGTRQDDYFWLRDDSHHDSEVLRYLAHERAYADGVMAPAQPLRAALLEELGRRAQADDSPVPHRQGGFLYYARHVRGARLPVEARRRGSMDAPEEVLLDGPQMAGADPRFTVGDHAVSPGGGLLAWTEDATGAGRFTLRVKRIEGGERLDDAVEGVAPRVVWSDDDRTLLYVSTAGASSGRRVMAHVLGEAASADRVVYEETDPGSRLTLSRTADDRYVCLNARSATSSEQRCAPAAAPHAFVPVGPRAAGVLYEADHAGGRWVMRTERDGRLRFLSDAAFAAGASAWRDLGSPGDGYVEAFHPFAGFVAVEERAGGVKRVRLVSDAGVSTLAPADEPAFTMALDLEQDAAGPWVRYTYTSLTTPETVCELNGATGERRVLKAQQVPGYDPSLYTTERVWARARDGTPIPVSLLHRKDLPRDRPAPLFQFGGGALGRAEDPVFSSYAVSLADRGVVFALAHVRGGGEMGPSWGEAGRGAHKLRGATDFVDVTRHLVRTGRADPARVVAMGRSYGGATITAAVEAAPHDYRAIILGGPFTDVTTTLLDDSDPATPAGRREWGDPRDRAVYERLLGESPYDTVSAHAYPAIYVGTGLADGPIGYHNSAKWVAKLRATLTGGGPVLLRVSEAPRGASDRLAPQADYLAFALTRLGFTR